MTLLEFSSDHFDYRSPQAMLHLTGHVVIKDSSATFKSDEFYMDTRSRVGFSPGFVLVDDGTAAVAGRTGEFDFADDTGTVYRASGAEDVWRIHAREAEVSPGRRIDYRSADYTSCTYDPHPDYHLHSGHLRFYPNRYFWATNSVFYLGSLPLFYTPFLYKSLNPEGSMVRYQIQPGSDHRNGNFVRGTAIVKFSPTFRGKLYLDDYALQGFGKGLELQHKAGIDRGLFYAYQIQETSTNRSRWVMLSDEYQTISSSVSFQGRFGLQSDPSFMNDYARTNLFPRAPFLLNNGALVYRTTGWLTRLSYNRYDAIDPTGTKFVRQTEDAPRIDFQTAPITFKRLPWINTFSASADNNYTLGQPFIQKSVSGGWEGTRTFRLAKGWSFVPKVSYNETYYNQVVDPTVLIPMATSTNTLVGRYRTDNDLRYASRVGDWDAIYSYARRFKPGTLTDDAGTVDGGVEANSLTLMDAFMPRRNVFARVSSSYEFRALNSSAIPIRQRLQPVTTDIIYVANSSFSLTLHDDYLLSQGDRSLIASADVGSRLSDYVTVGGGYNLGYSTSYFVNAGFGWTSSSGTWRLIGNFYSYAISQGGIGRLSRFSLFDKELRIVKNWHDFVTWVTLMERSGGVKEAAIHLTMRIGGGKNKGTVQPDWESEWFPERANPQIQRP